MTVKVYACTQIGIGIYNTLFISILSDIPIYNESHSITSMLLLTLAGATSATRHPEGFNLAMPYSQAVLKGILSDP